MLYRKPLGQRRPYQTCSIVYILDLLPPELNIWGLNLAGTVQSDASLLKRRRILEKISENNAQAAYIVSIGTSHTASAGFIGSDAATYSLNLRLLPI